MPDVPVIATIPPGIVSLADHEAHARTVLDDNAWAYFSGGAGDEITLRANRSAWAFQRLAHPDGELSTAYAAAQEAGLVLSCRSSTELEAVARAALDTARPAPLWFQLYLQHDRGFVRELIARAEQAGYEALVLTVDAPATVPVTASGGPASGYRRT